MVGSLGNREQHQFVAGEAVQLAARKGGHALLTVVELDEVCCELALVECFRSA